MESHINQDVVGKEFDKWLDWSAAAAAADNEESAFVPPTRLTTASGLPISPISIATSDSFAHNIGGSIHTAPHTHDLPTPTNSSSSPETRSNQFRLSGDTLRSDSSFMYTQNSLKRKLSPNDGSEQDYQPVAGRPSGSKRPHNVIEKRYRANLNEKIAELRDSVPALRVLKKAKAKRDDRTSSDEEDLDGLAPSNKLNKASILTKAVEYIRHLETRSKKIEEENAYLKDRLTKLEKVLADGGSDEAQTRAFTSKTVVDSPTDAASYNDSSAKPASEIKGMVGLPDDMRRLRESASQEHYGHIYASSPGGSRLSGRWPQRIMLGSLAGLMIMEGISESDNGDASQKKALFGIPMEILDGWTFLRSPRLYLTMFMQYCRSGGVFPLVKGFLALTILAFLVFYYMFNSKPSPKSEEESQRIEIPESARPASPIEVRRRAWSTSMQALGLPHHSFFPEWFAVTSEWVNYSIRYWLGPSACLWLCGETAEDETARIKAWDIAIDAQLAGGDTEVSRSRVVLTIFGSGTLPATPLRLMLKAVHTRVVLHNVGLAGTLSSKAASRIASIISNRQWRHARHLHETLPSKDVDRLPGYLNYLLQMDCDEVFTNVVVQRAYNMMYDRPTSEHTNSEDSLMDVIVEDHAIRSPLDAVAAWRSTSALYESLTVALQTPQATDLLREHIQAALEIAPPGSAAETRALAIHAVLSPGRRYAFYLKAAEATKSTSGGFQALDDKQDMDTLPYFIDSSTPESARPEIASCLTCAEVMLKLEQQRDLAGAVELLTRVQWPDLGFTSSGSTAIPSKLSIAPLYFVLTRLLSASRRASDCSSSDCEDNVHPLPQLNPLARDLYEYIRVEAFGFGMDTADRKSYLTPALDALSASWDLRSSGSGVVSASISRRPSSASHDTGYGSMEELESLDGNSVKALRDVFRNDSRFERDVSALAA